MSDQVVSKFASPQRDPSWRVREQYQTLCNHFIAHTLDAIPIILVVLNQHRQIMLANSQTLQTAKMGIDTILGKRPGEAFGCVHACQEPGGCGTSEFCSRCGAVRSILMGLDGHKNVQECNLLRRGSRGFEALDLQVSSAPIEVEGSPYVLFSIQDLSDQKRRLTLERLFFHDMLNTTGGLRGLTDILRQEVSDELKSDTNFIHSTLVHLVEELMAHKDLMAAESGELTPVFISLRSREALGWAAKMGASLAQSGGKTIEVEPSSADVEFVSDHALVKRVLGNMVKNALEASRPGDTIFLSCRSDPDRVLFQVHNPGVMSEDVRLRVFKRNFSTKGLGRGLGTYGMKLLSERYLDGEVSFTTRESEGTTFTLSLPLAPKHSESDKAHSA